MSTPASPPRGLPTAGSATSVAATTPWLPQGVCAGKVTLDGETAAFVGLARLSEGEVQQRLAMVERLRSVAHSVWPGCRVDPYGSLAVGLSREGSAVDIVVSRCGSNFSSVQQVAGRLGNVKAFSAGVGQGAFAQVETQPGDIVANISFLPGDATSVLQSVTTVKRWLKSIPALGGVHAVLQQLLDQAGCLNAASGGLSSYTLLVMIVHAARVGGTAVAASAGRLLHHTVLYYGHMFDFSRQCVVAENPIPAPKGALAGDFVVCDPLNPSNNLGDGCKRLFAVRAQFAHCAAALKRWEQDGQRPGYKGRTPLSGILSYQKMWQRAALMGVGTKEKEPEQQIAAPDRQSSGSQGSSGGLSDDDRSGDEDNVEADGMPTLLDDDDLEGAL